MPLVRKWRGIFGAIQYLANPDEAGDRRNASAAFNRGGSGCVFLALLLAVVRYDTFGGLMNVIIPRNSTIPIKIGEMFTTR